MKFVRDVIVFALVFFGTYMLVTYLMGRDISSQKLFESACYTIGATLGWGLVTYFKQKKQKENK